MSLLSRNTGGGRRRVATTAAVFAGTLLTYLVIAAVPAMAVSTCDTFDTAGVPNGGGTGSDELRVTLGADDKVVLWALAGNYGFSQNGGAFVACGSTNGPNTTANVGWVSVTGSDAGAETFTMFDPDAIVEANETNVTVDLKNGTDTLILEYGALPSPATPDPAAGIGAAVELGTSAGGIGIADVDDDNGVRATLKFTNAEVITLNGDNTASDFLNASGASPIAQNSAIDPFGVGVTGDDVPGSPAGSPFTQNLNLNGLGGDDLLFSGAGNDNFQGGAGNDTVDYLGAANGVVVDLTAATGTGMGADTLADVQNAIGSAFDDILTGNSLNNELSGGDGNDTIDGLAGNDQMFGEGGNDTILQGTAADGADTISGGGNNPTGDTLDYSGRTGALYVAPGGGAVSGEGGCPLGAGCEDDNINSDTENYLLGSAADQFVGSGADEYIVPGAGDDKVDGNGGFDYLSLEDVAGPATFDLITGTATGAGTDTFSDMEGYVGTAGDDTLKLGNTPIPSGNTLGDFAADGGIDTVDASAATQNRTINLNNFGFDCAPAGCLEVENAIGGSGNDTLTGNPLNNTLIGGEGTDNIAGNDGNDTIEGGLGNDILSGGAGGDTLSYKHATGGMEVDLSVGLTSGADGADSIGFFEIVLGTDFNDTITGGQSSVDVNNRYKGRGGNDLLIGTNSTDFLLGGGGNDTVQAGGGDDIGKGNAGNDDLFGSKGNDTLTGGKGNDFANGQGGADSCTAETKKSC